MLATSYVVNNDAITNREAVSTNTPTPEVPTLMTQTERLAREIGKLEENLAELWRFVADPGPSELKAESYPGGPVTDRLSWCFRTITHCSDMLNDIRSFVR